MSRSLAAGIAVVVTSICMAAQAADWGPGGSENGKETSHYVSLFTGLDLSSVGSYAGYVGATIAPFGKLEQSGVRVGLFNVESRYKYDTTVEVPTACEVPGDITSCDTTHIPRTVRGRGILGDLLLGYGVVQESWNAKIYAGLNVQNQSLSVPDPTNPVQGTKMGLKIQADAWVNPTKDSMLFLLFSYARPFKTYYSTVKAGYDFFGKEFFIGPEVILQGNERYDQWRVGAHITGIKISKDVELGLSAGYLHESDVPPGGYVKLELGFEF
jgi:hypothetical protein